MSRRLLFVFLTFTLGSLVCAAASDDGPFPPVVPLYPTIGDRIENGLKAAADFKQKAADLSDVIEAARQRFWKAYPSGPDFEAARADFAQALWQKNAYYLQVSLLEGVDSVKKDVLVFGPATDTKIVDHGINREAYPLFVQWVTSLRREAGVKKDGEMLADPRVFAKAITQPSSRRHAYERAQVWAEAMASGVDLSKALSTRQYFQLMMGTRVAVALGRAETAEVPDCDKATSDLYDTLVKIFGEKDVLGTADVVLHAPKSPAGDLATPFEVEVGTDVRAESTAAFLRFFTLLAGSNPRNYAIALQLDPYALLDSPDATYASGEKWLAAMAAYDKLVAKYGEANVLAVSTKLRAAQKSPTGGIVGDLQARPLLAWFLTALDDPRTVIPDGRIPHFKAAEFDPRWVGKYVAVRGTVSRVNLDTSGSPIYATIHFMESNGDHITGFTPNSDMLQDDYGQDFSGLVGKPVELLGEVQQWNQGAGVRILDRSQVKVVDAAFVTGDDPPGSRPDWLTTPAPTEAQIDSPDYLAWKKFPAGTKVTYMVRLLTETAPGTNLYTSSNTARITMTLKSIDDQRAVVVVGETVWEGNGGESREGAPSAPTEKTYPAKMAVDTSPAPAPNESGAETLTINGKTFATTWKSMWGHKPAPPYAPDPMAFTKTWVSDDVPGGLVLRHQQQYSMIGSPGYDKPFRTISETIIVPIEGVDPKLDGPSSAQPNPPAAAAPPATPSIPPVTAAAPSPAKNPMVAAQPPAASPAPPSAANASGADWRGQLPRYEKDILRASMARRNLQRKQLAQGSSLPADVIAARDQLNKQVLAASQAMRRRDADQMDSTLTSLEQTVTVIETYLKSGE
jgi:hypothetical protein